jgi:hypothetical protein
MNQTKTSSCHFFQINILIHVAFIDKWSLWDGFWTPSGLFSPRRLCKWIPIVVSTLLSYHARSHSTLNYTCPWNDLLFSHDQVFRWNSFHYRRGNVVSIHKPCFMFLILWCFCNTFIHAQIRCCNQRRMWSNNPWHHVHFKLSPQLDCCVARHDKCF